MKYIIHKNTEYRKDWAYSTRNWIRMIRVNGYSCSCSYSTPTRRVLTRLTCGTGRDGRHEWDAMTRMGCQCRCRCSSDHLISHLISSHLIECSLNLDSRAAVREGERREEKCKVHAAAGARDSREVRCGGAARRGALRAIRQSDHIRGRRQEAEGVASADSSTAQRSADIRVGGGGGIDTSNPNVRAIGQ